MLPVLLLLVVVNFSCRQWARENGCDWDSEYCCATAAQCGHLSIIQWLRENGGHWSTRTYSAAAAAAAAGGHLTRLQWARENGCPWDEETFVAAKRRGNPDVVSYVIQQGCPRRDLK